jgi:hypothetical protein
MMAVARNALCGRKSGYHVGRHDPDVVAIVYVGVIAALTEGDRQIRLLVGTEHILCPQILDEIRHSNEKGEIGTSTYSIESFLISYDEPAVGRYATRKDLAPSAGDARGTKVE